MPERFFYDDSRYDHRDARDHNGSTASSWLVPLLLLPIAFLGGWVANGYVNEGQVTNIPGIETGVGGGPDERNNLISPLPTSGVESPTVTVSPTPSEVEEPTPTEVEEP